MMTINRITTLLLLFVSSMALTDFASAQGSSQENVQGNTPEPYNDRYCMTCHGTDGRGNEAVQAPRLAGMEAWYLRRQLENFRSGLRGTHPEDIEGIAMRPMAIKLSDASIDDIIEWIAGWDTQPAEITLQGNDRRGKTLYRACSACHGEQAKGDAMFGAPALAGQNDWYLVTQLTNFKQGFRGYHENDSFGSQMRTMAATLVDDQAVLDVVSYINSLAAE